MVGGGATFGDCCCFADDSARARARSRRAESSSAMTASARARRRRRARMPDAAECGLARALAPLTNPATRSATLDTLLNNLQHLRDDDPTAEDFRCLSPLPEIATKPTPSTRSASCTR